MMMTSTELSITLCLCAFAFGRNDGFRLFDCSCVIDCSCIKPIFLRTKAINVVFSLNFICFSASLSKIKILVNR